MTSPAASGRHLLKFEMVVGVKNLPLPYDLMEVLGLRLPPSGWLQNAVKFCTKVRKTRAVGKESNSAKV